MKVTFLIAIYLITVWLRKRQRTIRAKLIPNKWTSIDKELAINLLIELLAWIIFLILAFS